MLKRICFELARLGIWNWDQRRKLLRWAGMRLDDTSIVESGLTVSDVSKLSNIILGQYVFINKGCFIDTAAYVSIQQKVAIAPGVHIHTTTHDYTNPTKRCGVATFFPVIIGAGSWVCARCTILAGAVIQSGVVVAANSLVIQHQTLEKNYIYGGSPAMRIQQIPFILDANINSVV